MRALLAAAGVAAALAFAPAAFGASPVPWCGTEQSALDRVPEAAAGAQVHVIYAVPSDGTDGSGQWAAQIAGDIAEIDGWWRSQDPTRTLRYDLYPFPGCAGFGQLDLSDVRLASSAASLRPRDVRFNRIASELGGGFSSQYKKYVVYYDGPVEDLNVCGEGADSGRGTGYAIVYLQSDCQRFGIPSSFVAAHELVHALGALPAGAPHACPGDAGHPCDSPTDLLYPKTVGGPLQSFVLDFGHDDYYAHSGSWLDLQDSSWLVHVGQQSHLTVVVSGPGTVESDAPGVDCQPSCDSDWNTGMQLTLTAEANPGYRLAGWSGGCTGTVDCLLTMDAAKTVTARFVKDVYPLRVKVVGRGKVTGAALSCPPRCSVALAAGSVARLRAVPAKGWRFKRWNGVCSGVVPRCAAPIEAVTNLRATFVRR